jgi:hypothetical protein
MYKSKFVFLMFILITNLCSFGRQDIAAQEKRGKKAGIIRYEPNVYAPELYEDTLKLEFTLVNLPGAAAKGSYWEGSYKLYFVPEGELEKLTKSNITAEDFQNKILLAEGNFRSNQLKTFDERTYTKALIPFRSKVPDQLQTKFANLVTSYSIKIYDAQLKKALYRSGVFIAHCFDDDERYSLSEKTVPRRIVYTNFFVTPGGDLFTSQWRHDRNNTSWSPPL